MENIRVLLFDFGGVLVDWAGNAPLIALSQGRLSSEQARRFWLESPWVIKFEVGACSPQEFAAGVVAELALEIAPDAFLDQFISWDRGFFPEALELLAQLNPHFLLACLSNNNELHWERLNNAVNLQALFHRLYSSHEIGFMKPTREAFEYVLQDLGYPPHQVVFFDDNPECVEAARQVGMPAYCVAGVTGVRKTLQALQIDV